VKRLFAAALALWCAGPARAAAVSLPQSPAFVTISPAELRERYDTVWAVSDIHGHLEELDALLVRAALVTRGSDGRLSWTEGKARQLLVVAGDLIDGGPDSVGVVLLFRSLQPQAAAAGSRLIVLLGNHEVDFMYNPRSASKELVSSAARAGIELRRKHRGDQLKEGELGQYLRELPLAATVGSWLFVHSGYMDVEDSDAALTDYLARIAASWTRGDADRYGPLSDPRSIVCYHNWWKSSHKRSLLQDHLERLGLEGLVFGHDPDALGAMGSIAIKRSGRLIKIDTGLKTHQSRGMLLRCEVARGIGSDGCRAMTPDGALHELPVR